MGGRSGGRAKTQEGEQGYELPVDGGGRIFLRIRMLGEPGEETTRMRRPRLSIFVLLHDIVGQRLQLLNQIRKVSAIIWNHGISPHGLHRLAIEYLKHDELILSR